MKLRKGPLSGFTIIELAGLGPAPFGAMLLADMGATVIRVDRIEGGSGIGVKPSFDVLARNRKNVQLDLKHPEGKKVLMRLLENADAMIEGFRPGVLERLGFCPDELLSQNPKLVIGRMTGWGQDGPLAQRSGHDINYIALAGALFSIGEKDRPPVPPLNLVGDFGGGGLLLAFGILCALLEAKNSGKGQVVDAAMVEGAALLTAGIHGMLAQGMFQEKRGETILNGGAPFYAVYECSDGEFVTIGALEPHFFDELLSRLDIDPQTYGNRNDRDQWQAQREMLADKFASKTRDEWADALQDTDVCFAPVLRMTEASSHPHNMERGTFVDVEGFVQPAPAPRFSRTDTGECDRPSPPGADTEQILAHYGFTADEISALQADGAVAGMGTK
ncbi:CaiB/BaiF CoA transferase family protein [Parasphingorhabdus sp.]|uniref:CaiB/BaiF CoA transferase family protein n=1 Tax=Parasphingorhabdus sp. TaxID=2709688 RepID=UPI003A952FC2